MSILEVFKRDDVTINIEVKDSDDVAVDITGFTFWLTVKENEIDIDGDALIQKEVTSHSDPTNGITAIELTNTETDVVVGKYFYDIQMVDVGGKVSTLVKNYINIRQDITISS